jgi:ABC-2 type transport system permease protein
MTAATVDRPALNQPVVTQPRVIVSEWIKLRSLRSTFWSLVAASVFIIGLGLLFASVQAGNWADRPHQDVWDPTWISLQGAFLAQLAIGVLGVMAVTGEYSTGMIRATLSAVPRRLPVLWAKLAVFAVTVFVAMGIALLAAFLIGQAVLSSTHAQASLTSPGSARAILGGALYLSLLAMLGIGLGFLIRNTAGAIATLFGLLLILPVLSQALPSPWDGRVTKYLPMPSGSGIMTTVRDTSSLTPWAGLGVFALYAVVAVALGAVMLRRRDA